MSTVQPRCDFQRTLSNLLRYARVILPSVALAGGAAGQLPTQADPHPLFKHASFFADTFQDIALRGEPSLSGSEAASVSFTVSRKPSHGAVTLDRESKTSWFYTPATGFTGIDEFRVSAMTGDVQQTQRIVVSVHSRPSSRVLYVDALKGRDNNDGSMSKPFATIQAASDATLPGDTVLIKDGTYGQTSSEAVVWIARSGAPEARITYKPYPGAHPKIFSRSAWNAVLITASWIRVEGLDIAGNLPGVSIEQANAVYDRFLASGPTYGPETSFAETNGISIRPANQKAPIDERIYPRHIEILNNFVHDAQGGGISAQWSDYITVHGNDIRNVAARSLFACSGISILGSQDTDSDQPDYRMRIENNRVENARTYVKWYTTKAMSDGNGIILDSNRNEKPKGEPYQGRYLVANNVVLHSGGAGIQVFSTDNTDIVFNTVYDNSLTPGLNYGQIWVHAATNIRVLNNIVVAGVEGKINQLFANNRNVIYDYNVYFGGRLPEMSGEHDLIADPKMVDPSNGNFALRPESPAVDSATVTVKISLDFAGRTRPAGRGSDRGAFEYQPATKPARKAKASNE